MAILRNLLNQLLSYNTASYKHFAERATAPQNHNLWSAVEKVQGHNLNGKRVKQMATDDTTGCDVQVMMRSQATHSQCSWSTRTSLALQVEEIQRIFHDRHTFTPALVIEIVCCSMASWMATWSRRSILSNSSMQQTPWTQQENETWLNKNWQYS